jgi:polyphosphate kinase 2 (PPK2 family)
MYRLQIKLGFNQNKNKKEHQEVSKAMVTARVSLLLVFSAISSAGMQPYFSHISAVANTRSAAIKLSMLCNNEHDNQKIYFFRDIRAMPSSLLKVDLCSKGHFSSAFRVQGKHCLLSASC